MEQIDRRTFQYILCYFLSIQTEIDRATQKNFNTSYVIFYHTEAELDNGTTEISIHPMLFFIHSASFGACPKQIFQYILCYFLSSILWFLRLVLFGFQYILCYFLSDFYFAEAGRLIIFQYILCYFLSKRLRAGCRTSFNFNTSYVIFYLRLLNRKIL